MTQSTRVLSKNNKYASPLTGFTLLELLITMAIITVITGLVIARYATFDSTVVLRSVAYDVATSLREAQIYSVSVYNVLGGGGAVFRYPYGLTFTKDATSYTFFRFNSDVGTQFPIYQASPDDGVSESVVRVLGLNGSTKISDICIVRSNGSEDCSISRLDISFRRPEFTALIYAHGYGASSGVSSVDIAAARVKLQSTKSSASTWIAEIKLLGQITVYKL